MTQDEKYNGWSNWATWCVNLWLTNDQATYEMVKGVIAEEMSAADGERDTDCFDTAVYNAAERLHEIIDEANPIDGAASLYTDLLASALNHVDWREIVMSFTEE